jgi:carboxyl-terminal processing protease
MRFTISICLVICLIVPSIAQESSSQKALTNEEKIYGLSLLWKEVSYNFAYFEQVPEIDWDKTYQVYIPKVIATKSIIEYYDVLKQFLALLKCGHTRIIPPQEYREYFDEPKIKLINIQNKAIVKNVGESLI